MIRSKEIQNIVAEGISLDPFSPADNTLPLGHYEIPYSETVIELDDSHRGQIRKIIDDSMAAYPNEDTLVWDVLGKPTAIARVDCTIGPNGITPYEFEDRPAGIGVDHLLRQRLTGQGSIEGIQTHIAEAFGSEVVVVRHADAYPSDDGVALRVTDDIRSVNGNVILVRGEPHMFGDEETYTELASKSISTIRTEGDKSYSLNVPEFEALEITSPVEMPRPDASFMLKKPQGSKAKGVSLYLNPEDRKIYGERGTVTHGKASRLVDEAGRMILEKFKPPVRVAGMGNMALRVMALVGKERTDVIGGCYVVRPELIVHGASNSFAGLVTMEAAG